jgi:acyl-CoA reductase-like NAD-dependent aldehyde dehydrogenase
MVIQNNKLPMLATKWSSEKAEHQFAVYNPATDKVITVIQGGGAEEIDAAVSAADKAFHEVWKHVPAQERGSLLRKSAEIIKLNLEELAILESKENGKPINQARDDVEKCVKAFEYFGCLVGNIPNELLDLGPIYVPIFLEPYGVVGGILPYNWPPIHMAAKTAPVLAAGNTVVLKPAEQAPLTVIRLVELIQDVFPKNVINVVAGIGPETGQALVSHPLVRKISFTGASATGVSILKEAANNLTPCILELGGKNPMIVFEDANIDSAVRGAVEGAFYNSGQACTAASRIIVHRSIQEEFVDRLAKVVKEMKVGDGANSTTHIGPLVSQQQKKRVLDYIDIGIKEGAVIAAEGKLPEEPELKDGYFVKPIIFTNVDTKMRIAQEEIFGPVTCILTFDDIEEAISIANDSEYGLVASIYTASHDFAMRVARQLDVGTVFINNYYRGGVGVPFGGNKASGFGRERALETIREFGRSKAVKVLSGLGNVKEWDTENHD